MNELAHEKSPYLLQHADNPVAWRPWGEEAFAAARGEDKPIFLSIGYSTCHWCHVMAHESFEDAAVAKLLNDHFIPIKVDREERPDVDKVYMAYVQALTGHGGWPLSAWLTPELKPFYGGTYFPPDERHGRPSFGAVLRALARGWREERTKLLAESERVLEVLRPPTEAAPGSSAGDLGEAAGLAFEKCFQYLHETFDPAHGGFGGAPKFPRASNLDFLFRVAALQGLTSEAGAEAIRLATATLQGMARGGIHDHVGGGYHRYSVDAAWGVPHFEKMLYDQAQIAVNFLEAKQATGDERYAWMARDILGYVSRELTSPGGALYTAEDADSALPDAPEQHGEGAYYIWTAAELRALLGDDYGLFAGHFGVEEHGNVPGEQDPQQEFVGRNILRQQRSIGATAAAAGLSPEEASLRLGGLLEKVREARSRRPRPLLDDKIVTANNGLMISALARAAGVLGEAGFAQAAAAAADFIYRELWDAAAGTIYRAWREGRGRNQGFAEDYAFLIQGLLDLYENTFALRWLQWAEKLQATMDRLFWDDTSGAYFNSAVGDSSIVLRLKETYDGAEPAATSVAASNLLRLGAIFDPPSQPTIPQRPASTGEAPVPHVLAYRDRAIRSLRALEREWSGSPPALPALLCAMELALSPPRHVVLAGVPSSPEFVALKTVLSEKLRVRRAVVAIGESPEADAWLTARVPWLEGMAVPVSGAAAFVCEEFACLAPAFSPGELRERLERA